MGDESLGIPLCVESVHSWTLEFFFSSKYFAGTVAMENVFVSQIRASGSATAASLRVEFRNGVQYPPEEIDRRGVTYGCRFEISRYQAIRYSKSVPSHPVRYYTRYCSNISLMKYSYAGPVSRLSTADCSNSLIWPLETFQPSLRDRRR